MTIKEILGVLDTVIRDLNHPTTLRAPDGVYLDMKNRVIGVRDALDALEMSKPEPIKKGK